MQPKALTSSYASNKALLFPTTYDFPPNWSVQVDYGSSCIHLQDNIETHVIGPLRYNLLAFVDASNLQNTPRLVAGNLGIYSRHLRPSILVWVNCNDSEFRAQCIQEIKGSDARTLVGFLSLFNVG